MSLLGNIKKRGLKDILNPRKWIIYLRSKLSGGVYLEKNEAISYAEQLVYRTYLCRPCLLNGACYECECPAPDLFIDKDNWCSAHNWYQMLPPDEWEELKQKEGIKIIVEFS